MWTQLRTASGYLVIFLVPVLLLAGIELDVPSLAFGVVFLLFPFTRTVFGGVESEAVLWREDIATVLDRLPLLYAAVLPVTVALVLGHFPMSGPHATAHILGLGLSLWITMLLAICVAHELIHRRDARFALVGYCIAGIAGYPILGQEHLVHHARSGDTHSAECPRLDESMWQFALRRAVRIFCDTYAPGSAFWSPTAPSRPQQRLRIATAVSALTWIAFVLAGGWTGGALYLGVMIGTTFGVQLVTYIQHWGLGDDSLGSDRASSEFGWEDDCRFQSWITLGLSFHNAHHQSSQRPYYRIALASDSPRLPAGYLILMVISLFPRLWRNVMQPALNHWQSDASRPRSPGRSLTCFALYRD